jgi:hypothetical protein
MDVRRGEGGISSKVASQPSFPITGDHRLQHVAPVMGAMDGAGAQRASLQVAELVENEQEMVVGAAEMAIVDRALMVARTTSFGGQRIRREIFVKSLRPRRRVPRA